MEKDAKRTRYVLDELARNGLGQPRGEPAPPNLLVDKPVTRPGVLVIAGLL